MKMKAFKRGLRHPLELIWPRKHIVAVNLHGNQAQNEIFAKKAVKGFEACSLAQASKYEVSMLTLTVKENF